jgi:hypothetical protein
MGTVTQAMSIAASRQAGPNQEGGSRLVIDTSS